MYNFDELIKIIDQSNYIEDVIKSFIKENQLELKPEDNKVLSKLLEFYSVYHCEPIIAKTDTQGNIIYVNDAFLKVSKYSREELIGQNIRILRSGHMESSIYKELWSTISLGSAWYGELKNCTKDYDSYWVSIFIAPIFDENGNIVNYWSLAFDVSEKYKVKEALAQKQNDIMDSIKYAKRIQKTILPEKKAMDGIVEDYFIIYRPRDILSGDFYWFNQVIDKAFVAVVDCTGHGVPGAFMSLIGYNLLNQIVIQKGIHKASEILTELHRQVRATLKQDQEVPEHRTKSHDGMDVCLVVINKYDDTFEFAGANRPLLMLKNDEIIEIKPTKFSIGGEQIEEERSFENNYIEYETGDTIYMFSDGFVDQFGGPEQKKFSTKRLKQVILETKKESMNTQRALINMVWKEWKGDEEQVDDVTMIGIRF